MTSIFQLPFRGKDHTRDEPMADMLARASEPSELIPIDEGNWQSLDMLRAQLFGAADHRNAIRERMEKLQAELQAAENAVHVAQRRLEIEVEKSKAEVL